MKKEYSSPEMFLNRQAELARAMAALTPSDGNDNYSVDNDDEKWGDIT